MKKDWKKVNPETYFDKKKSFLGAVWKTKKKIVQNIKKFSFMMLQK